MLFRAELVAEGLIPPEQEIRGSQAEAPSSTPGSGHVDSYLWLNENYGPPLPWYPDLNPSLQPG